MKHETFEIPPKVEGKIVATMKRLLAQMNDGPVTVSDRRRWLTHQIPNGPIAWTAARRLVNNGEALVVRKTIATIRRGPRRPGARLAHQLTIVRREPDAI